jgi:hypothetical protein
MAQQQRTYPSLDKTGTQAAVYPSEEALWAVGPPINAPGDQNVAYTPTPGPTMSPQAEDDYLHEVMNGQTPGTDAYGERWVNIENYGPTGFGPWTNEGIFYTGHSQNIVSNPAAEQGWGVGPARRWAHFPIVDLPNPTRNFGSHLRNGVLPWVTASSSLYERSQLAWEQQWAPYKQRSPLAPVVQVAPSVPFVQTVPTYSGGDAPHPGVDVPFDDSAVFGIPPVY